MAATACPDEDRRLDALNSRDRSRRTAWVRAGGTPMGSPEELIPSGPSISNRRSGSKRTFLRPLNLLLWGLVPGPVGAFLARPGGALTESSPIRLRRLALASRFLLRGAGRAWRI